VREPKLKGKSYDIPKRLLWDAWLKVKKNGGAAGADGVTIEQFEEDLSGNLYRLWNRMSSGSYFPGPVRAVEIPKRDKKDGVRVLGIPSVVDRVAQAAAAMALEPSVEPVFHEDSYGYRPGRSPVDAVAVCRERCFRKDWVVDLDIRAFFDSVPWDLMLRAVAHHTDQKWIVLYVERCLKAPMQRPDGTLVPRVKGTPQGSPISPCLANLFLHVCPERKVKRCRRSFCDSCCAGDGGRSFGLAVQAGSPNRRGVMPVKSRGGKRLRNGSLLAGQVGDEKTNMVEPLLTHRKTMTASQPGLVHISGRASCYLAWCSQRTACVSLWRCSVLRWRELVAGAGMEQENLCLETVDQAGCVLVARGRTLGGRNRLGQSTARRRGGPARTSVEGPVMGLERRGRAGQLTRMPTRWLGRS
jgi:retron-type reverse transcriptase